MSTQYDKKTHGNRYDTGPVIGANVNGMHGGWCNGRFAGHKTLVKNARFAAEIGVHVDLGELTVTADATTPLGALAALAWSNPGRLIVTQAPDEILDLLVRDHAPDGVNLFVSG